MTYNDNDDDHDVCDRREGVLIHQCLKKKKNWRKKIGTSSNILQACVLFVKTGI